MNRARVDGGELDYELCGDGDLVVFVHHGAGADWFLPLFSEPILIDRFRLLRYHRPGYAGSSPLVGEFSFTREAATFRELMRYLGARRAHVVGHSASACIALQMALDVPGSVHSLTLMEPALLDHTALPKFRRRLDCIRRGIGLLLSRCSFAERVAHTRGQSWRWRSRMQSIVRWQTQGRSSATSCLHCVSGRSGRTRRVGFRSPFSPFSGRPAIHAFMSGTSSLLSWLPHAESFVLPGAGHLLHLENRNGLANGLADFLARHAIRSRLVQPSASLKPMLSGGSIEPKPRSEAATPRKDVTASEDSSWSPDPLDAGDVDACEGPNLTM